MDALPPDPIEFIASTGVTVGGEDNPPRLRPRASEGPEDSSLGLLAGAEVLLPSRSTWRFGFAGKYRYAGYHMPHALGYVWKRFGRENRHGPRLGIGGAWTFGGGDPMPDVPFDQGNFVALADIGYYACFGEGETAMFLGGSLFFGRHFASRNTGYADTMMSAMLSIGIAIRPRPLPLPREPSVWSVPGE
jgi:hypothetical protein